MKNFSRMKTCGSDECKKKLKNDWTFRNKCMDCGTPIAFFAKRCKICSSIGSNNPFYGKTHKKESLVNIKLFEKGHTPWIKGRHQSESSLNKIRGEKHWNWKGGVNSIQKLIRRSPKYKDWRKKCFQRDKYTCKKCNTSGVYLIVHHKKRFSILMQEAIAKSPLLSILDACMCYEPFWDTNNGVTLCDDCHKKTKTYGKR